MKKVITLILDDELAKEIFDEYYELADFVSIETEDEAESRNMGFDTWDNLDLDADEYTPQDVCEHCMNIDCDCDTKI